MICSFCGTDTSKGVKGPEQLFICFGCVGDLSSQNEIQEEGTCSWCGAKIGRIKGIIRRKKIRIAAKNYTTGVILCSGCGKLCQDIMKEESSA